MFDARTPLRGPLDYSNPAVTRATHTDTHRHTGDLHLKEEQSGGFDRRTATGEEVARVC